MKDKIFTQIVSQEILKLFIFFQYVYQMIKFKKVIKIKHIMNLWNILIS